MAGCHKHQLSTWHLKPNEKLLIKNKLVVKNNKELNREEIQSYIRQKPNKSILFGTWKFSLQWKNLRYNSKKNKKRPAVVLDSSLIERSERQIEIYLKNQGYYNAKLETEIRPKYFLGVKRWETKKATVIYSVSPKDALVIDSLGCMIKQPTIQTLHNLQRANSKIVKGEILKIENLELERTRISNLLSNKGYYKFAENFVRFNVDSSRGKDSTIVITKIKQPGLDSLHNQYYINDIYVNTSFNPYSSNNITTDTVYFKGIKFISKGPSKFKPAPLYRGLFFKSGELYSHEKESQTFRQFANLQMFSFIKIDFKEVVDSNGIHLLNAYILLQPSNRMSISAELMGTYREGFGANGQISFARKNAFGNSEILNFSITGGVENLKQIDDDDFKLGSTIGPRLSLTFPRLFLLPQVTKKIPQSAFPQTTFSTYFNFQQRSRYTRYLTNLSLTYEWNEGKYKKHEISIPDINFSFITKDSKILSPSSLLTLSPQQKFKFENAISAGIKYSFLFNNQTNKDIKNPIYFTTKGWIVGPSAILADALGWEARDENNAITLANIRYATFFKAQADYRKFFNIRNEQQIAIRSFLGFAIPLDKDGVIPFDQLYFSGGANSVRGWRQRTVGPGSYFEPNDNLDKLGEVKIEASIEYRFPITNIIKGAVFADAGNVWTEEPDTDADNYDPNFAFNRFYKELAVSPGLGLRLDFDFFLFRLDLGVPIKQPYHHSTWKLDPVNTQLNFGVGYPF